MAAFDNYFSENL